jgi:4a-hydroxytetrahydrobiopterin dehydratase
MQEDLCDLKARRCKPCELGTSSLNGEAVARYLAATPGWETADNTITKKFDFKNFYQTMAFVNAVAWIAHCEGHHPEMEVSYRFCRVCYTTHAIGGLSENDFICAVKVNGLIAN